MEHNASCADDGIFSDCDAGTDDHVASDPHIVADIHFKGIHLPMFAQLVMDRMSGCDDHHIRGDQDAVSDADGIVVNQRQIAIHIDVVSQRYGFSDGNCQRRLHLGVFADGSENLRKHFRASGTLFRAKMIEIVTETFGSRLKLKILIGVSPEPSFCFALFHFSVGIAHRFLFPPFL